MLAKLARNIPTEELISVINSNNRDIYHTMLEGGDYRSMIEDMIEADLGEHCYNFATAMKAIHTTRRRFYVGTRDITNEVLYVWDNEYFDVDSDLQHTMEDDENIALGNQASVIAYVDDREIFEEDKTPAPVKYLQMLDMIYDFPIDESKGHLQNLNKFKAYLQKLEMMYLSTISCMYLPQLVLTSVEKKTLKKSEDTAEVNALILKIFENWGVANKSAGKYARNAVAAGNDEGIGSYKVNRHLEKMGIYRKQYYRFLAEGAVPSKRLVLGLALYFAPNEEESIERFMNAFGYSLKSNVMSLAEKDEHKTKRTQMQDRYVRKLLHSGLDTELILMLIAEECNEVKKSASSPNFS